MTHCPETGCWYCTTVDVISG